MRHLISSIKLIQSKNDKELILDQIEFFLHMTSEKKQYARGYTLLQTIQKIAEDSETKFNERVMSEIVADDIFYQFMLELMTKTNKNHLPIFWRRMLSHTYPKLKEVSCKRMIAYFTEV
jgi:hypothetical protein